jgi:hypothetical protein
MLKSKFSLSRHFEYANEQIPYHFWLCGGGGLLMYVRSDIACDRKDKLEFKCIDSIMVDIYINIRKWIITGVYRPPSIKDENFSNDFISTCDKLSTTYDNFLVIGDLNYDMLSPQKVYLFKTCM